MQRSTRTGPDGLTNFDIEARFRSVDSVSGNGHRRDRDSNCARKRVQQYSPSVSSPDSPVKQFVNLSFLSPSFTLALATLLAIPGSAYGTGKKEASETVVATAQSVSFWPDAPGPLLLMAAGTIMVAFTVRRRQQIARRLGSDS